MSATICWRAATPGKQLPLMAPGRFIASMNTAFGSYPWRLSPSCIATLLGMSAVFDPEILAKEENPYDILIKKIEEYGEIIVEVDY